MKKTFLNTLPICLFLLFCTSVAVNSQQSGPSIPRDTILLAAKEIITSAPYCALVTVDENGQPQIRTMNPFPFKGEFVVWFATSRDSEKVKEIKKEPRVCVYYADHKAPQGYVNLMGKATIIDDKELLKKMKRDYWNGIPNWENIFVLIKIEPVKMEVINYKHGVNGNPGAPSVEF
jgi:general stress protein 26